MELLVNESAAQQKAKEGAEKVNQTIENSPENKAVIYPNEKKARRNCTLSEEMIKLLEKNGFNRVKRTNGGSHQKMYNPITNATTIVPLHTKALGKGLETAILKQAKLK